MQNKTIENIESGVSRLSAARQRKRVHNADEIMAEIVAKRLVEHLDRAGFVVMKRPAEIGARAGAGIRRIGRDLLPVLLLRASLSYQTVIPISTTCWRPPLGPARDLPQT